MIFNIYNRLNESLYCYYCSVRFIICNIVNCIKQLKTSVVKYSRKVLIEMRFKQTTSEVKAVDVIVDCYVRWVKGNYRSFIKYERNKAWN